MKFQKGQLAWNKGKTPSKKIKTKMSVAQKKRFLIDKPWNKGKKMSEEQISKLNLSGLSKGRILRKGWKMPEEQRTTMSGLNSHRWKGGITPLVLKIRMCFEYRQWRSDVFTRDGFTCVKCGIVGTELNADHYPKTFAEIFNQYKPKSLSEALLIEEFWNINNGRTLCENCHKKFGRRENKHHLINKK